jgi:hypothetical protein
VVAALVVSPSSLTRPAPVTIRGVPQWLSGCVVVGPTVFPLVDHRNPRYQALLRRMGLE